MSSVKFNHSNAEGQQTIAVFITKDDGTHVERIVSPANPSFDRLVQYFLSNFGKSPEEFDAELVHGLVDPSVGVGRLLREEFGDRVTFDLRHFYIDGIPETGVVHEAIKEKVLSGAIDWERYVRFFIRLTENPSKKAQAAVWGWIEKHGVSLAEDGRMLGFKGLVNGTDAVTGETDVPVSYHSGPNNFIDGVLYGEAGVAYQVPHRLGTVISKRRADVDDNTRLACSTGLHVGAYSYAKTFGENRDESARYSTMGRMATTLPKSTFALVAFGPEAVVSVPEDGTSDWKIRVHEYEVTEFLEEVKDVLKDKPIYNVATAAPFLPRGQEVSTDGVVEQPEPEPEVPADVQWWEIYGTDNLGETIYETISGTEEDAQEVLKVHDPEGQFGYDYRETDAPGEEPEDAAVAAADTLSQDALVEAASEAVALQEDVQEDAPLVEPREGTGLFNRVVLRDWAALNPGLARDLADSSIGHSEIARKYSGITTESSVRRYRKNDLDHSR